MISLWTSFVSYWWAESTDGRLSQPSTTLFGANQDGAEGLVAEILEIYGKLKSRECLKPCDEVDALFERLVDICIVNRRSEITAQVLEDSRLRAIRSDLRLLCEKAECCLESHWAEIIIGQGNASPDEVYQRLKTFPYFQNYIDLTRLELSALHGVRTDGSPITKIAFLGSGPLPLTSLCLSGLSNNPLPISLPTIPSTSSTPITVLNIDLNPHAISQSTLLCQKLGPLIHGMEFLCALAGSPDVDLREFDVVYLAALVGSTQEEKERVLADVVVRMRVGALLVVRSADRLRRVLYPAFDPSSETVLKYLDICAVVHPYDHVVNSVVIGKVKRREEVRTS
ncbi:hypothetical protein EG329_012556 [Mollisiaceae sp. DMI_Dod_QoI]|nr:hypothetical protein EG329_012556 [Helotiales sp. DMI_Dod_QoI]